MAKVFSTWLCLDDSKARRKSQRRFGYNRQKGAIKYLDQFIEDTYLQGKGIQNPEWRKPGVKPKPFGGTIPISGQREITTGDGLILVGDAAGFTSPLFEEVLILHYGQDVRLQQLLLRQSNPVTYPIR